MQIKVGDFTVFIDDAMALAESIEADITSGEKISNETVLRLSRFITTAEPVLNAMLESESNKGNLQ